MFYPIRKSSVKEQKARFDWCLSCRDTWRYLLLSLFYTCHEQFEQVQNAVNALGLGIETEYITDMEKVMSYGVMSMPAIVVNETVVSMGKVLKSADVIKLLKKLGYC